MKKKKTKNYWEKRKELFANGSDAKTRAGTLRSHEHVTHVLVDRDEKGYTVSYSVARWYLEELKKSNIKL